MTAPAATGAAGSYRAMRCGAAACRLRALRRRSPRRVSAMRYRRLRLSPAARSDAARHGWLQGCATCRYRLLATSCASLAAIAPWGLRLPRLSLPPRVAATIGIAAIRQCRGAPRQLASGNAAIGQGRLRAASSPGYRRPRDRGTILPQGTVVPLANGG